MKAEDEWGEGEGGNWEEGGKEEGRRKGEERVRTGRREGRDERGDGRRKGGLGGDESKSWGGGTKVTGKEKRRSSQGMLPSSYTTYIDIQYLVDVFCEDT